MFGFISDIFSSKPSTQQAVYRDDDSETASVSTDGLTGVARYLNAHAATPRGPSSVDKYLNSRAQKSGVAKYVARQAIAAKKKAKVTPKSTTGVAKYLADNADAKPVKSGVSKYLSNRKEATVSGVSKYMLKQALAAKDKPEVVKKNEITGVAKYLESKPVRRTSGVAKYLAKQVAIAKQKAEEAASAVEEAVVEPTVALTGVEKYLSKQAA